MRLLHSQRGRVEFFIFTLEEPLHGSRRIGLRRLYSLDRAIEHVLKGSGLRTLAGRLDRRDAGNRKDGGNGRGHRILLDQRKRSIERWTMSLTAEMAETFAW